MNDIATYTEHLPDNLQDLNSFILVGREKLTAVRAEIRAIEKLELAEEVRKQKRDEARMLSEALLDAEVRVGELTKRIPKSVGGRPEKTLDSGVQSFVSNSGVTNFDNNTEVLPQKTKAEVLADMGFGQRQVSRYETLADNKDLVEQVKAEARANDEIPTRGKVLELAKAREQKQKQELQPAVYDYQDIDRRSNLAKSFHKAVTGIAHYDPTREDLECFIEFFPPDAVDDLLNYCDEGIRNLQTIKSLYRERSAKHGKKN